MGSCIGMREDTHVLDRIAWRHATPRAVGPDDGIGRASHPYLNDGHLLVQVRVHWVKANQLRADVYV